MAVFLDGESQNVEYKVAVPKDSSKYMKTVVAFANGSGGRILFGIDDKTRAVVGMDSDTIFQTIDAITNAISDSCEPRIFPDVTLQTIGDKTIIVAEISAGKQRPYPNLYRTRRSASFAAHLNGKNTWHTLKK